ncbi:MAG: hypothetical protein JSU90_10510, partial [Nitrospiraceae bacterium]
MKPLTLLMIILFCSSPRCSGQTLRADKPHHAQKGFRNLHLEEDHGFTDFLRWQWERLWKNIPPPE